MSLMGIVCFGAFAVVCLYIAYIVIAGLTGHLSRMQADSSALVEKLYPEYVQRSKAVAHTSRRYDHQHLGV